MPGDLITTSQAARAARPPPEVGSTGRPSAPPAGGQSSTSPGSRPREMSVRRLARPSTPRPHTPTWPRASAPPGWPPRASARRSDQEIVGRIGIRDEVVAERAEQLGRGGQPRQAVQLRGQYLEQLAAGPVGPLRGEQRRSPALADLAHALERLAGGGGAERGTELVGQAGAVAGIRAGTVVAVQRLVPPEDRFQLGGRHERRQDQVDEAALVAAAAPVGEPERLVDMKGTVTAAERVVVLGQRGE